jgi:ribosomal protein S18 acetylase RimI-like enzyme
MSDNEINYSRPEIDEIGQLVSLWMRLADGQRKFGSDVSVTENRTQIQDVIAQHIVDDQIWVAKTDRQIIGFVLYAIEEGYYVLSEARGIIRDLFVREDYRSQGVGSHLLNRAEMSLSGAGVTVIILDSMADNSAARDFYQSHDYTVHRVTYRKDIENDTHSKGE